MPLDANTAGQRYAAAAGTAQTRWSEGIQSTTKDPGQLAAQAINKYLTNVTQAATSGYTARRMQEGSAKWKPNSLAKASNYATGVQQGQNAYVQGYQNFWNAVGGQFQAIQQMPKNNLSDSIAKMTAWVQLAASYQKP